MGFLQGKRALIVGVASKRSIAWSIAEAMQCGKIGAELSRLEEGEATHIIRSPDIDAAFESISLDDALDIEV